MGGPGWKTTAKIAGVPDEYQQLAREEQVKHKRAAERLDRDCLLACQPQIDTPFKSAMDALERLLPFHVFYNDNDDEMALLEEKEMPKGDPAKVKLNTRNVKNDEKAQENQALQREAWREKQEARGEATTKRLLDTLEKCESAAKRLYMTDDLRGEERLFIETLLRDEEKALAPPKKGLRTSRTAEAKVTEVKAEVKAPQTDVKSPQTEVTAPQTEVTAPQTEVKAPQTEVAAPQAEVTAPQTEVTAPQTEVKAEAMPQ